MTARHLIQALNNCPHNVILVSHSHDQKHGNASRPPSCLESSRSFDGTQEPIVPGRIRRVHSGGLLHHGNRSHRNQTSMNVTQNTALARLDARHPPMSKPNLARGDSLSPVERSATFSRCQQYRYTLWRDWRDLLTPAGYVMFIGLNPSTADDFQDDPTIRRCIRFTTSWGYGAMCMTNAFAFRTKSPKVMKKQTDPVGADNDKHLMNIAADAAIIVAAWGADGCFMGRDQQIREMFRGRLHYLDLTDAGQPRHPLYLKKSLTPQLLLH